MTAKPTPSPSAGSVLALDGLHEAGQILCGMASGYFSDGQTELSTAMASDAAKVLDLINPAIELLTAAPAPVPTQTWVDFETPAGRTISSGYAKRALEDTAISIEGLHPFTDIKWSDTASCLRQIVELISEMEKRLPAPVLVIESDQKENSTCMEGSVANESVPLSGPPALIRAVQKHIVDHIDSGASNDRQITITNGDLIEWYDALEVAEAILTRGTSNGTL